MISSEHTLLLQSIGPVQLPIFFLGTDKVADVADDVIGFSLSFCVCSPVRCLECWDGIWFSLFLVSFPYSLSTFDADAGDRSVRLLAGANNAIQHNTVASTAGHAPAVVLIGFRIHWVTWNGSASKKGESYRETYYFSTSCVWCWQHQQTSLHTVVGYLLHLK